MANKSVKLSHSSAELAGAQGLDAVHLRKTYAPRSVTFRPHPRVTALADVSLAVGRGQTLGVVGESGSGKSTLARCLACLERPDSGEIRFDGQSLTALRSAPLRAVRRKIQMIFQASGAALNPRFSAIEAVTEPLLIAGALANRERRERGLALMEQVGLERSCAGRNCMQLSGGQRQRLAIARALSLDPEVLILDESLSGLDLPVQAQIINLLVDLQERQSISYIHITHDLRLAAYVADHLAVMQQGRIVEQGPTNQVCSDPRHPHSRELLGAVLYLPYGG